MNIVLSGTSSTWKTSIVKQFPKKYNTIFNDDLFKKYDFRICRNNLLKNKLFLQIKKKKKFLKIVYIKN